MSRSNYANEILADKIIEQEEEIATLKAEILELRTEEEDESEPHTYAQNIIDTRDIGEIEKLVQWHNEVSEYLEVYLGYHRAVEDSEDD